MAWTITETIRHSKMKSQQADELITVKLACTSDASGTDYDLTSAIMDQVKGSWFYALIIEPGTGGDAPSGTFDVDIENEDDMHILDTDANPVSPTGGRTYHIGSTTSGFYVPVEAHSTSQISLVSATLGDANTATFYLLFTR